MKKIVSSLALLCLSLMIACGMMNASNHKKIADKIMPAKVSKAADIAGSTPNWKLDIPNEWQPISSINTLMLPRTKNVLTVRSLKTYGELKIIISLDVGNSNLTNDELLLESIALMEDAPHVKGKKIKFKGHEATIVAANSSMIMIVQIIVKKNNSDHVYVFRCAGTPSPDLADHCINTLNTMIID